MIKKAMTYTKPLKWEKKGLIFKPKGEFSWSKSHAQVPVVDYLEEENIIKVYYSTRNEEGYSMPGYVLLDGDNPKKIIKIANEPILQLGELGCFDDCGVMPSWLVNRDNGEKWLYYIGWNVRNTIPYHNSIGLAISKDGGESFAKFSKGPLWDRNHIEPHYSGTSCVLFHNQIWKNWYLSCTEWRIVDGKSEPRYHIKYAESIDGINWKIRGDVAIDYKSPDEAGIVKASVIIEDNTFKMWYSYRLFKDYRTSVNSSYRIGYAESQDGINWERMDDSPLALSVSNDELCWDSLMVEYPHVIDIKGKRMMFYNGNGFGKSGFGYAQLIKS
ncbi:MAG: hypothetical protein R2816_06010 [Flavobacteriaceae bacterium]